MRSLRPLLLLVLLLPALASAQPSIVSVNPNSAARGARVDVQITGAQTLFLQDSQTTSIVWLSQGAPRIDADSVHVASATSLNGIFHIPTDAPLGLWDVHVKQVDSSVVTLANGFTITSACAISDLAAGTQTPCNASTNTYTQVVVVTYANPPASGNLAVNGQSFTIGTSPQSVTLTGLAANGAAVNVTASFSADAGCSRTENALFTAPASCSVSACSISDLAAGAQTPCAPATNTYTQVVVVTFANPPASGNLVVNGQSFTIGTSPQSVTLTGLNANGASVNVTARFSADTGCSRTESGLFPAPVSCGQVSPLDCSDAEASKEVLHSKSQKLKNVRIEDVEGRDEDEDDVTITITSVTSDEPVGATCPDAVIHTDGSVDLRAESSSTGNGRVYTIHFTATSTAGGSCEDSVTVCVPQDAHDGDDDDDDQTAVLGSSTVTGDNGLGQGRGNDHHAKDHHGNGHDGDGHDGDGHDGDDHGHCIRDAVQYDATVCAAPSVNLPSPSTPPVGTNPPVVVRGGKGTVTIQFTNARPGPVDLRIFDLRGRLVRQLTTDGYTAGEHALRWDGRDAEGHEVATGIYLVRVVMDGMSHTSKTVWMR